MTAEDIRPSPESQPPRDWKGHPHEKTPRQHRLLTHRLHCCRLRVHRIREGKAQSPPAPQAGSNSPSLTPTRASFQRTSARHPGNSGGRIRQLKLRLTSRTMGKPARELDLITDFRSAMRTFALQVHLMEHLRRLIGCQAEIERSSTKIAGYPLLNRASSNPHQLPRLVTSLLSCLDP